MLVCELKTTMFGGGRPPVLVAYTASLAKMFIHLTTSKIFQKMFYLHVTMHFLSSNRDRSSWWRFVTFLQMFFWS